jgi:hypothetical protein
MNEIPIKMVNGWWSENGSEFCSFLSELSGDRFFHQKLHVSDRINVFNCANINKIHKDAEARNYLLGEVCGEIAEQVLACKHAKKPDELFDGDGNFYEPYQEEFNRLYDCIEEKLTELNKQ